MKKLWLALNLIFLGHSLQGYECDCYDQVSFWRDLNCGSVGVSAEFLYWQPVVTGMEYVSQGSSLSGVVTAGGADIAVFNVDRNFHPGFRLGCDYTLSNSRWKLDTIWTHLYTSDSSSVSGTNLNAGFDQTDGLDAITFASAHFVTKLDYVTFSIGREINFSDHFSMYASAGGGYYRFNFTETGFYVGTVIPTNTGLPSTPGFVDAQVRGINYGWGIQFAQKAFWHLPGGFDLFGSFLLGTSLINTTLYVDSSLVSDNAVYPTTDFAGVYGRPAVQANVLVRLGLNWNSHLPYFCNLMKYFISYDFQYFSDVTLGPFSIGIGFRGLTAGTSLQF